MNDKRVFCKDCKWILGFNNNDRGNLCYYAGTTKSFYFDPITGDHLGDGDTLKVHLFYHHRCIDRNADCDCGFYTPRDEGGDA